MGVARPRLTKADIHILERYDWPGNIRELQNVVERSVILSKGGRLQLQLGSANVLPMPEPTDRSRGAVEVADLGLDDLPRLERSIIERALEAAQWKVWGEDGAAARLGMRPTTLAYRIKKLGIEKR